MKADSLAAVAALSLLASVASIVPFAREARADDSVRACIAASTDGQTLRQRGKLLASRDQLIACARDACPAVVRSHCARWLKEVETAIPSVVVRAVDASGADVIGAHLSIDGRPQRLDGQPVRLDPGPHTVAIESDGAPRKEERVLLLEGEASRRVIVRLPRPGPAAVASPPTSRRIPLGAWILGGAGLVTLGFATYFGLAAKSDLDGLQASCSPHCTGAQTQPGRTDAVVFDVLLGVGASAVAGAIVWGLAFPSRADDGSPPVQVGVRPLPGGGFATVGLAY